MFWNWEMVQLTGEAKYSDLFEWQLYNAAAVGMATDGAKYLYNNPLTCRGGVTRRPWYQVPCCPSNISRTWAGLGKYLYHHDENNVWVHQYINSETMLEKFASLKLKVETGLPWQGAVRIEVVPQETREFSLKLRIPSWASGVEARLNGEKQEILARDRTTKQIDPAASGYDPRPSLFWSLRRTWSPGDVVEMAFNMDIQPRRAHPKVQGHSNKAAISRGPLVYCLESVDNPAVDIFTVQIDPTTLSERFEPDLLGGASVITAESFDSQPLAFIPYHLWGNRGPSQMTVWVNT
jgi:DUF1680 family protein